MQAASGDGPTEVRQASSTNHHFVQAPIRALDEDGVTAAIIGTAGFGVASIVLWLMRGQAWDAAHHWYLWVALAGFGLGVIGTAYCVRRRNRNTQS